MGNFVNALHSQMAIRSSGTGPYAGQFASVALCMYQALQKADSSLASLCSGPETGLARWVRIKKQ